MGAIIETLKKEVSERNLNIIIFTEGIPGHLSQSLGIANLIRDPKTIRTVSVDIEASDEETKLRVFSGVNHFIGLPTRNSLWKRASEYFSPDDLDFLRTAKPDIVISAGTHAASFNILLSKIKKCKNIVAMRPSLLPIGAFDLVVLPFHDFKGVSARNVIVLDTSPNQCLPELIKPEEINLTFKHGVNPNHKYWALFLGGPSTSREFPEDVVLKTVNLILEFAKKSGTKLLVTTSRRTESGFESALKALISKYSDQVSFLQIYHEMPEPTTKAIMSLADKVFITEDSVSMVSESIWANRKTYMIPLPAKTTGKPYKISKFKDNLLKKGLVCEFTSETALKSLENASKPYDLDSFNDIEKLSKSLNSLLEEIV